VGDNITIRNGLSENGDVITISARGTQSQNLELKNYNGGTVFEVTNSPIFDASLRMFNSAGESKISMKSNTGNINGVSANFQL
jgi:hypothetical protein